MPPLDINALRQAIGRRIGVGHSRPTPVSSPVANPNILRLMQLIQMARQNRQPGQGLALGHIRQQFRDMIPQAQPGEQQTPPVGNSMPTENPMLMNPIGAISKPEPIPAITRLPQQHSQIGLQAPYQAFGSNPMQAAAQNRLQKRNMGMVGGQGNFGNTSGEGGGTEPNPAGAKQPQQKHRKVTIEEYR